MKTRSKIIDDNEMERIQIWLVGYCLNIILNVNLIVQRQDEDFIIYLIVFLMNYQITNQHMCVWIWISSLSLIVFCVIQVINIVLLKSYVKLW